MSWLDILPSSERAKIRARLRSPEAYEKLREKVKGPEQLKQEMDKNEQLAELNFALELEPKLKEELKKDIEANMQEQGIEGCIEFIEDVSEEQQASLEAGQFDVGVDVHPDTNQDQLMLYPNGNVSEKLAISTALSDQYLAQFTEGINQSDPDNQ